MRTGAHMNEPSLSSLLAFLIAVGLSAGCGDDTQVEGGGGHGGGGDGAGDVGGGGGGGQDSAGGGGDGGGGGEPIGRLQLLDPGLPVDLTPDGDIAVLESLEEVE